MSGESNANPISWIMVGADAPAGTYSAPELVLCPSAWTNQMLLPFGIQLELRQRAPAEADARRE